MAAAGPVLPPEEVALLELGTAAAPPAEGAAGRAEPPGDPAATLPWEPCQRGARSQPEPERRPSPDGGRRDAEEDSPPCEAEGEEPRGQPTAPAHVSVPIDPRCIERKRPSDPRPRERGEGGCAAPHGNRPHDLLRQKQVFLPLGCRDVPGYGGRAAKAPAEASRCPCAGPGCSSDGLRAVASAAGAVLLCPCLVYGAYVFLPFDAPLLPTVSARLVYTLRCAAFATFPVVLGMIVHGISRLCSSSLEPFGELQREVEIHRAYVSQSVHLFVLYFFNMAVLATYLPQEALKLVPLLTGLFAISRLIYWLLYAVGRSFRAFGFSMTFLPLLAMLFCNLYGLFVLEPENLLAVAGAKAEGPSKDGGNKLRFWG
ncbi:transmembrane protein 79 [Rhea pennata]|uniref:transmembrane protein 79 n=1 Tax=Rhea pennata TaxID=8795 RepID=UPI002E258280